MRRLNPLIALFAAMTIPLSGLMVAAPAMAYNISAVYKDCENNGTLTGHYSRAELQAALSNIPAQVSEYSSCQVLIQQALLKSSSPGRGHDPRSAVGGGRGSHRGGGGSGKGSPGHHKGKSDPAATRRARAPGGTGKTAGVSLGGSDIRAGSTGAGGGSSSLPVALIVVLILIALTAVSGGVVAIRRRVDAGPGT